MEKIKKTILQVLTTESVPCSSGITGPCHIIVPDLLAVYHMKINLTAELMDVGFLDAYVEPVVPEPIIPPEPPVDTDYLINTDDSIFADNDNITLFEYE